MAILDFLNPSPEEIKKRTATALANNGRPQELDALKKEEDLKTLPAQPLPGLGGTVGPSPASVAEVAPPVSAPPGNWAMKAGAAPSSNPYGDAFKAAGQVASQMPTGGLEMQKTATKNIGDIQSQGFADREGVYKEQEIANNESQARLKQIQAEKETAKKEFDSKYDAAKKEVDGMEVDNDRFWKNASTGKKIMTGIGLALSAFGGPEAVARTNQIIQSSIDADIDQQKTAYAMKKEGLRDMSSVYARMMDEFGDKEKAELATRALYNEKIQSKIQQIADRTNSKAAKENATNAIGQLESQRDGIVSQLGLTLASSSASKPMEYGKPIPDNYTPKNEEEGKRVVQGYGLATDAEAAKKMRATVQAVSDFNSMIAEAKNIRESEGGAMIGKNASALSRLTRQMQVKIKDIEELGALSAGEWGVLEDIVPDLSRFDTPGRQPVIEALSQLENQAKAKLSRAAQLNISNPFSNMGAKLNRGGL